ncbi:unnamed protein product [Urochloa decumbens]|uniref:Uncharacterized protein n=1 Tax=Urochloa decumbens TaxID=240449 RepID=A0ABC9F4D7_9POAL
MVLKFRTAADIAVASSAVYAVFGAALAYPAAAPTATALAFVIGYGALLFLLPFSVFALEFLRPPRCLHQTPRSIVACAVATPVALLAAVLAVPGAATRASGDAVAVAVWAVDAAALGWCLTNGGFTAVAFSRRTQFANFMDAMKRTPEIGYPLIVVGDQLAARREAGRLVVALSAVCAAAGGAAVGALSPSGLWSGTAAAFVLFALPMCLLYVPEYQMDCYPTVVGVLKRNPMAAWYVLLAPTGLVLGRLVAAIIMATATGAAARHGPFVAIAATAGGIWAVDAVAAVLLGRHIAEEIAKPSIFKASSKEIVSAVIMVGLRYFLYLHVFRIIGSGGQLTWFNSIAGADILVV